MRRAFIPVICLASAACNLAPPHQQPDLPIAGSFEGRDVAYAGGDRFAAEIGWQEFFGDPQLRYLIAEALKHNRDLAISVARIEQARAFHRIQNAARLPQVGAAAGASQTSAPAGAIDPAFADSNATVRFEQYNVQVAVTSFELDFWGRVANMSEAARRSYLATVAAKQSFRLSLIGNVAATYYSIRAGEEGVDLAERTLASRVYARDIAKLRLDAGVTSSADYKQAVILVAQAEMQLAELRRTTGEARNRLTVLVGGPIEGSLPDARPIDDAGQFRTLDAGLPSELLLNRPDIAQAEQLLRAADANIGAARADFFPRIGLTGNFGYASAELGSLFAAGTQTWSVGAFANLPIFDGGQRRSQLAQAQARRDELVAVYQRTVQIAFGEVSDALIGRQRFEEQIQAQKQAVNAQQRLAETADLRHRNGVAIYLEVVDAQRSLFAAEQQLIMLRAAALQNGVSLYVALGGGRDALVESGTD